MTTIRDTISVVLNVHGAQARSEFVKTEHAAKRFGKSTKVALGGIAVGAAAGFALLGQSMKEAADEQVGIAKLAKVLENAGVSKAQTDSVEQFVTQLQNATGVADDKLRPAFAKLVSAGIPLRDAQRDIAIALDIAAARGLDVETVTKAMGKAAQGSTASLSRLGLRTKDAAGHALTLQQSLDSAKKSMGGTAKAAADTAQGKLKIMSLQFQDIREKLGAALLPALAAFANFLIDKVIPAIEATVVWVQTHWPAIQKTIREQVDKIMGYLAPVLNTLAALWRRFGDTITRYVLGTFNAIRRIVSGVLLVIRGIVDVFTGVLTGHWGRAWDGIKRIFEGVWLAIRGVVEQAVNIIQSVLRGAWAAIGDTILSAWGRIQGFFRTIFAHIRTAFHGLRDALVAVWEWIGDKLQAIYDNTIGPVFDKVKEAVDALKGAAGFLLGDESAGDVAKRKGSVGGGIHRIQNPRASTGGRGSTQSTQADYTIHVASLDPAQSASLVVDALKVYNRTRGAIPIAVR